MKTYEQLIAEWNALNLSAGELIAELVKHGLKLRSSMEHSCPECEIGTLKETVVDFPSTSDAGQPIVIPSALILRCNACGQEMIPAATLERIEAAEAGKE